MRHMIEMARLLPVLQERERHLIAASKVSPCPEPHPSKRKKTTPNRHAPNQPLPQTTHPLTQPIFVLEGNPRPPRPERQVQRAYQQHLARLSFRERAEDLVFAAIRRYP